MKAQKTSYYNIPRHDNFRDLITHSAQNTPNQTALQLKVSAGKYRYISYKEMYEIYLSLCTSLIRRGLEGKRIALCGENSGGWAISYLAAATVGVVVPVDKELSGRDIANFCEAAECKAIFADGKVQGKLDGVLKFDVTYDLADVPNIPIKYTPEDVKKINSFTYPPDEMRVLIFTSGTTGSSKGVCLSMFNICSNVYQISRVIRVFPNDKVLSILPLHHTYAATVDMLCLLAQGACISYCDGLNRVATNLKEYNNTVIVVVPALLKVLSKRLRMAIAKECPAKYKRAFEELSLAEALKTLPFLIRRVICSNVKKSLGGKLRMMVVGAAAIDPALIEDFNALGIKTVQGYGLTETSPILSANNDFFYDPETAGCAIPGVTLRISNPDENGVGEIIAAGDNVMLGYYRDEAATAAVIKNRWFHTGDLGMIDRNGGVHIKGRIKNVIVTSNGKNIFPEEIEDRLSEHEIVSECLVLEGKDRHGDPCVRAKIYPSLDHLSEVLGHTPDPNEIKSAVNDAVNAVNDAVPQYKKIQKFDILTTPLERTTTQKIKRYGDNMK